MTSMPASRRARAMIFAPRSWPSRPGLATTTRIFWLVLGADIGRGRGGSMAARALATRGGAARVDGTHVRRGPEGPRGPAFEAGRPRLRHLELERHAGV